MTPFNDCGAVLTLPFVSCLEGRDGMLACGRPGGGGGGGGAPTTISRAQEQI